MIESEEEASMKENKVEEVSQGDKIDKARNSHNSKNRGNSIQGKLTSDFSSIGVK